MSWSFFPELLWLRQSAVGEIREDGKCVAIPLRIEEEMPRNSSGPISHNSFIINGFLRIICPRSLKFGHIYDLKNFVLD
jgi:hypothetical protein